MSVFDQKISKGDQHIIVRIPASDTKQVKQKAKRRQMALAAVGFDVTVKMKSVWLRGSHTGEETKYTELYWEYNTEAERVRLYLKYGKYAEHIIRSMDMADPNELYENCVFNNWLII